MPAKVKEAYWCKHLTAFTFTTKHNTWLCLNGTITYPNITRICNASIPDIIGSCHTSYIVSHIRFLHLFLQYSLCLFKYIIRAMKYHNHVLNNKCRPRDSLLLLNRIGKKKIKKMKKIKIQSQIKIKIQIQIKNIKKIS